METSPRGCATLRGGQGAAHPVDLFDPIHDALFIPRPPHQHNNIQVRCSAVKGRNWTQGDRNQIQQVFLNLFANACDAMSSREVRELSVSVGPETKEEKSYWCCTSPTLARASLKSCRSGFSNRFSRPSRAAKAPAWA
jgi:signal transduction histidine kinase